MAITLGIDEVGRGAWAGSMLFCGVVLAKKIDGLSDSKKLAKAKREKYAEQIKKSASWIGYGWVSASEIDDLGLTKASELACKRVLSNLPIYFQEKCLIMLDGKINYLKDSNYKVTCLVNGDQSVPEISAASIIAKVTRDEYMIKQAKIYQLYNFDKNVGYGTKQHLTALQTHGFTPIHRLSYKPLKDILNNYEA